MNNFYTKIVGMVSEKCNLVNLKQWFDISTIFFFISCLKRYSKQKSNYKFFLLVLVMLKINLDVVIASCNL